MSAFVEGGRAAMFSGSGSKGKYPATIYVVYVLKAVVCSYKS